MAKTRLPAPSSPRPCSSWTQYTRLCAMTSSVISSCALVVCWPGSVPTKARSVPNASECSRTRTGFPPVSSRARSQIWARFSGAGALTCPERAERAEREGVQRAADCLPARQLASAVADLGPLLGIGGVDVPEVGLGARGAYVVRDRLGQRQRGLGIQVPPDDAHPAATQLARRGRPEAARRPEHHAPLPLERPPARHRRAGAHKSL